ncbi:MAG: SixA phosphatase family protein [Spirochaetota bacterium]
MKQLTLFRHGKAEPHGNGIEDFQRQLLKQGVEGVTEVAQRAVEAWGTPDAVLSSPAVRALSTAELFAEELTTADDIQLFEELYAADSGDILDVIRQLPADADHVVIVGHNPSLEELAFFLLKNEVDLKPGACIHLILDIERWKDFSITLTPHDAQVITPSS